MGDTVWFCEEETHVALCALSGPYTNTPDETPPYSIRNAAIAILYPLEHIFNARYIESELPSSVEAHICCIDPYESVLQF